MTPEFPIITLDLYWRYPLGFVTAVDGCVVALLCPFDETVGEYQDYFNVSLVVSALPAEVRAENFHLEDYPHVSLGPLQTADCDFSHIFYVQSAKLEDKVREYQKRKEG